MKRWYARPHATLILIWLLVGAIPLPVREVMPPDESRFTHQAQNMRETGEWIVPKIGDVPNADKPPVIFWLANLFSLGAERVTASGSRVQSALGALLAAFLTLRLGRRLFGSESLGLLGAAEGSPIGAAAPGGDHGRRRTDARARKLRDQDR